MGKFKYLTYDDRKIIEKMYKSGMSTPKIANALGKTIVQSIESYIDALRITLLTKPRQM